MTNQISTQAITFYGSELITLKFGDVIYTAVKPIVESIGLDWGGQQQKLAKYGSKFNCRDISIVAKDGKIREMLCMPIRKLNGWLFSINPEKVRPDLKEKVICYQEECFEALYNYWNKGKAERSKERSQTTVDDRTGLRDAVNVLVAKRKLTHSEVYGFIHQRFNVEKIEQLTAKQILQAIEYVQKLTIGVEITLPSPEKKYTFEFTEYELQKLAWLWFAFKRGVGTFQHIHKSFEALGSNLSTQIYGQAYEYLSVLRASNQILNRITEEFEADPMTSWRVLTHLREFDPKAVKINF